MSILFSTFLKEKKIASKRGGGLCGKISKKIKKKSAKIGVYIIGIKYI